jgi:Xaa-Pro aminopeptidase
MAFAEVESRRVRAADAWNLSHELVVIGAGHPISIPGGADQTFPYAPHPQYRWLADKRREGGVLAFDPKEGWTLFEPPITESEIVWGGGEAPTGRPISGLKDWLAARAGRYVANLGSAVPEAQSDPVLSQRLSLALDHARRPKDHFEIERLQKSAGATFAGYQKLTELIKPGITERLLQVEFEAAVCRAGASGVGYGTIVGTGSNSAVFHFVPGDRVVAPGDLVLVDAGAQVDGYVTDVTRTFAADGSFSPNQQLVYNAVRKALVDCCAACRVGVEWLDIHRMAATILAESLREMELLNCSAEEAVSSEAIAMFLPHGVGHLVGLGVRDASGPFPGRTREARTAGIRIRMDLPLDEGYVTTVEPGLYFVPAILNDPVRRQKFTDQVNWKNLEPWIGTGGIRLEDNILVTAHGPVNLTEAIPK